MISDHSAPRSERSWILYDTANSAFVLIVITAIGPIYFKDFAATGLSNAVATANWGFANSSASLILALLSLLGTFADFKDQKKKFFSVFLFVGLMFTASLTLVQPGQWILCLLLYVMARIGWAGANIFYDSFLPDVAAPEQMDSVSTRGYAWGYIGSVVPFLAVIGLLLFAGSSEGGLPPPSR